MNTGQGARLLESIIGEPPNNSIVNSWFRKGVFNQYERGGIEAQALAEHYWMDYEEFIAPERISKSQADIETDDQLPKHKSKPPDSIPPDGRGRALAEILAFDASNDPEVVTFRGQELNNKLIKVGGIQHWLESKSGPGGTYETKDIPGQKLKEPFKVKRGNYFIHYDKPGHERPGIVEVHRSDAIKALESVSEVLTRRYGWSKPSAVTFVLTGEVPQIRRAIVKLAFNDKYQALNRITLDLDPRLKPVEVQKLYAQHRRSLGVVDDRARGMTSEKRLALAVFLHRHLESDETWDGLMKFWNRQHRKWRYDNYPQFSIDAKKALKAVTGNEWQGKGSQ